MARKGEITGKRAPNFKNLTGQRFGMLLVIQLLSEKSSNGQTRYKCLCDCGKVLDMTRSNMIRAKTCGHTKGERFKNQIGDKHPNWKGGHMNIGSLAWSSTWMNSSRRASIKRGYIPLDTSITPEMMLELWKEKGHECGNCKTPDYEKPVCIDHSHETGNFRGFLCNDCNLGLGQLGDTIESIEKALEYLKKAEGYTTKNEVEELLSSLCLT